MAAGATPWSWLLPGSRIHVWQPQIRPLLFALGLRDFFREHPTASVWATGCPPEVSEYLDEFLAGAVRIVGRSDEVLSPTSILHRMRTRAQPLLGVLSSLRRVPIRARTPRPGTGADLLVFSIALSERSVRERGDHYFGRVLDDGPLNVHWLYQLAGSTGRAGIEEAVRHTGRKTTWVHDCVGWSDVLSLLRTVAAVRRRLRRIAPGVPPLRIAGATSSAFAGRFFRQLLVNGSLLGELIVYRATDALVRAVRPRAVCYPYEEKGLEHAIALAARRGATCRTIGFAHAAYASGYLYLRAQSPDEAPSPRPTVLASAGRGLAGWLHREFGRDDAVVYVGSPRWTPAPASSRDHAPRTPLRVLVVTSFAHELEVMADWIEEVPDMFEGMTVSIRPNPHAWRREQAAAFERLGATPGVTVDAASSLDDQIAACDVVVFCATSAAAEAMWHGRCVVYAEWSDLWITDPTKGRAGDTAVTRCSTAPALRTALRAIASLDRAGYAQLVAEQREVATEIYGPFNADRFRDLVMESPLV